MKQVNRQAIVPFSCEQMFALVDDIESYSDFLPYCSGTEVFERNNNEVTASITVAKGSFEQSFTTKNQNLPFREIKMTLIDGPFKYLNGLWTFTPLSESAAKIELLIEFEFANKLLGLAFGKVFQQLAENFVDAFTTRAKSVYGN